MKLLAPTLRSLTLAAAASICVAQPPASGPASTDEPRGRGAQLFTETGCPRCHTIHHNGGTKGPDLSSVGRRLNESQIRNQITVGSKQMPAFGDVLNPTELDDLIAYLRSCRDKTPK